MKNLKKIISVVLTICVLFAGVKFAVKQIYPVKYIDYINKYSEIYNVDSYLLMSVIKAESNFDTSAVSSKAATGLMQITEDTANWIAQRLCFDDFEYEKDILNPEININMGSFYIDYLNDMYGGRIECVLAAYNAGFNKVDEWLSNPDYSKDGVSLDKIPYPETERYVNKVDNNYKIYKLLYKEVDSNEKC